MSLADHQARVTAFAQVDTAVVSSDDRNRAIQNAVRTYSAVRPRRLTGALVGAGPWLLTSLAAGWLADSHRVVSVAVAGGARLDVNDWCVYQESNGAWWLSSLYGDPIVTYSAPHELDEDTDTIALEAPGDLEAVAHLAASYVLAIAANYYARMSQSSLSADAVNYQQLQSNYGSRAGAERAEFDRHMRTRARKGSSRLEWDRRSSTGHPFLFHGRRRF